MDYEDDRVRSFNVPIIIVLLFSPEGSSFPPLLLVEPNALTIKEFSRYLYYMPMTRAMFYSHLQSEVGRYSVLLETGLCWRHILSVNSAKIAAHVISRTEHSNSAKKRCQLPILPMACDSLWTDLLSLTTLVIR